MATMICRDLSLRIECAQVGYRARRLDLPAGDAVADLALPFLRLESPEIEAAKILGGCLCLRLAGVPMPADLLWQHLYNPTLNCNLSLSRVPPRVSSEPAAACSASLRLLVIILHSAQLVEFSNRKSELCTVFNHER